MGMTEVATQMLNGTSEPMALTTRQLRPFVKVIQRCKGLLLKTQFLPILLRIEVLSPSPASKRPESKSAKTHEVVIPNGPLLTRSTIPESMLLRRKLMKSPRLRGQKKMETEAEAMLKAKVKESQARNQAKTKQAVRIHTTVATETIKVTTEVELREMEAPDRIAVLKQQSSPKGAANESTRSSPIQDGAMTRIVATRHMMHRGRATGTSGTRTTLGVRKMRKTHGNRKTRKMRGTRKIHGTTVAGEIAKTPNTL